MQFKIIVIFVLSILIPTALLSYFGLLAVRSEQAVIEKNMRQQYETMADIVASEIEKKLEAHPKEVLENPAQLHALFLEEAAIFKDHIIIFDKNGKSVSGQVVIGSSPPLVRRPIKNLPYTIAVYEPYPFLLEKLQVRKEGLVFYMAIIGFSALLILGGGGFTLWSLSREWRLAQVKSEFVSHLSHDLRTPLTSIRMLSEMLKDGRVSSEEKQKEYYTIIASEGERLTHLANNILDFTRIERGTKQYSFKTENIVRLIKETTDLFQTYMLDTQRPVTVNACEELPEVSIDASAIAQAFLNLLINARKYSPPDTPIHINVKRNKGEVIIEVIDQGIGVSPREQKRIFRKFYRAPGDNVSEKKGSGLGLALVKYIAEAHRGKVRVESREGEGSTFSLILPLG